MSSDAVEVDELFERLLPETLTDGDWVVVHERPRLVMSRRTVEPEVSLLRVQYELDLPFPDTAALMRPEVSFDPRRPEYDSGILECGIYRFFSPGDAVGWMLPRIGSKSAVFGISRAAVLCAKERAGSMMVSSEKLPKDALPVRWIFRRSFPSPESCAVVCAPICAESGEVLEQQGVLRALAASYSPHPEDPLQRTVAIEVRLLRNVPDWSIEHMAGYYLRKEEWIAHYKASDVCAEARLGPSSYVVVGLGKLVRGPPLLPKERRSGDLVIATVGGTVGDARLVVNASAWEPADPGGNCAAYLRAFLRLLGVEVDVYETLDGRSLVYYQALFHRGDWELAWAKLRGPWREHCAAYRKRNGGKCAPKIVADTEPRFAQRVAYTSSGPSPGPAVGVAKSDTVPVARSFVHFAAPPGLVLPRSNSNPELDTLA